MFVIACYLNVGISIKSYEVEHNEYEYDGTHKMKKVKLTSKAEEEWKNLTHAITHMGPHKTGTTSACDRFLRATNFILKLIH